MTNQDNIKYQKSNMKNIRGIRMDISKIKI